MEKYIVEVESLKDLMYQDDKINHFKYKDKHIYYIAYLSSDYFVVKMYISDREYKGYIYLDGDEVKVSTIPRGNTIPIINVKRFNYFRKILEEYFSECEKNSSECMGSN